MTKTLSPTGETQTATVTPSVAETPAMLPEEISGAGGLDCPHETPASSARLLVAERIELSLLELAAAENAAQGAEIILRGNRQQGREFLQLALAQLNEAEVE